MKPRNFNKRLSLGKNTVVNLGYHDMMYAKAAGDDVKEQSVYLPLTSPCYCSDTCCTQNTSHYPGACC